MKPTSAHGHITVPGRGDVEVTADLFDRLIDGDTLPRTRTGSSTAGPSRQWVPRASRTPTPNPPCSGIDASSSRARVTSLGSAGHRTGAGSPAPKTATGRDRRRRRRIPIEAHLRLETGGTRHGRVWTDDPAVDMNHITPAAVRVLRVGQRAASFTVDRILDRHAHITGTGIAPF